MCHCKATLRASTLAFHDLFKKVLNGLVQVSCLALVCITLENRKLNLELDADSKNLGSVSLNFRLVSFWDFFTFLFLFFGSFLKLQENESHLSVEKFKSLTFLLLPFLFDKRINLANS